MYIYYICYLTLAAIHAKIITLPPVLICAAMNEESLFLPASPHTLNQATLVVVYSFVVFILFAGFTGKRCIIIITHSLNTYLYRGSLSAPFVLPIIMPGPERSVDPCASVAKAGISINQDLKRLYTIVGLGRLALVAGKVSRLCAARCGALTKER